MHVVVILQNPVHTLVRPDIDTDTCNITPRWVPIVLDCHQDPNGASVRSGKWEWVNRVGEVESKTASAGSVRGN